MKILKSIVLITLAACFFFMGFVECLALDVSLTSKEENYLLYYPIILDSCQEKDDENRNCTKYLIRYDGLADQIAKIQELSLKKDYTKLKTSGIVLVGTAALGAGVYLLPFSVMLKILGVTLLGTLGGATVCTAYNEVIEPTGRTFGYLTNSLSNLINYFIGKNSTKNSNNGFVGAVLNTMCGNRANGNSTTLTNFKNFLFGKSLHREIKETEAFKKLLEEFYTQVKERKFENNNILIISMDFTDIDNIKTKLKFDKTNLHLGRYPQKDEEYFKDWL